MLNRTFLPNARLARLLGAIILFVGLIGVAPGTGPALAAPQDLSRDRDERELVARGHPAGRADHRQTEADQWVVVVERR